MKVLDDIGVEFWTCPFCGNWNEEDGEVLASYDMVCDCGAHAEKRWVLVRDVDGIEREFPYPGVHTVPSGYLPVWG